jgi:CheY-like chemotaxis protein
MQQVILADDSRTIQKVVHLSLAGEDFVVHDFSDGPTALEYLRLRGGDIVLADVSLPSLDGYDLCREIKLDPRTTSIPVILLANTFDPFDEERARKAGFDGYLTKPFQTAQLVEMVERLVAGSHLRGKTQAPPQRRVDAAEDLSKDLFLNLPGPRGTEQSFLSLKPEQCRPCGDRLPRLEHRPSERAPASQGGADLDVDAVVERVMEKLPEALRELVPGLTREMIKDRNQN